MRIVNNTSLTAIAMPDGSRHLFFQSATGELRHAALHKSTGDWKLNEEKRLAKPHTSLAVVPSPTSFAFQLFYIDPEGRLATSLFGENPECPEHHVDPVIQSFPISATPKSLAAASVVGSEHPAAFVLFYEDPSGSVMAMRNTYPAFYGSHTKQDLKPGSWLNVTGIFHANTHDTQRHDLSLQSPLSAPFTVDLWNCYGYFSSPDSPSDPSAPIVRSIFFESLAKGNAAIPFPNSLLSPTVLVLYDAQKCGRPIGNHRLCANQGLAPSNAANSDFSREKRLDSLLTKDPGHPVEWGPLLGCKSDPADALWGTEHDISLQPACVCSGAWTIRDVCLSPAR